MLREILFPKFLNCSHMTASKTELRKPGLNSTGIQNLIEDTLFMEFNINMSKHKRK